MIMSDKGDLVPLTTLIPGERGRVAVLGHGRGRQLRFRTMGLIEGRMIRVVATQPMRGPSLWMPGELRWQLAEGWQLRYWWKGWDDCKSDTFDG
jgi:FeoA domain.